MAKGSFQLRLRAGNASSVEDAQLTAAHQLALGLAKCGSAGTLTQGLLCILFFLLLLPACYSFASV